MSFRRVCLHQIPNLVRRSLPSHFVPTSLTSNRAQRSPHLSVGTNYVSVQCHPSVSMKIRAPESKAQINLYGIMRHPALSMKIRAPESKAQINLYGIMVRRMFSILNEFADIDVETLLAKVDWRGSGTMTAIDEQGEQTSCWIHSALSAVEAVRKLETGILQKLSSQELIDHFKKTGDSYGTAEEAFEYIQENGVSLEKEYLHCQSTYTKIFIRGYEMLPGDDGEEIAENWLRKAVTLQPVVAVMSVADRFDSYRAGDGIYEPHTDTGPGDLHSLLVVGYGIRHGQKFWIIRNSYGTKWGYQGYGLVRRGFGPLHGVCDAVELGSSSFPVISIYNTT